MDPFIGMILPWAGTWAPQDWIFCDGRTLPISGNEVLFSLIGVTYGGNGTVDFGIPDLRGRIPLGANMGNTTGQAPALGAFGGASTVPLDTGHMAAHSHGATLGTAGTATFKVANTPGSTNAVTQGATLGAVTGDQVLYSGSAATVPLAAQTVAIPITLAATSGVPVAQVPTVPPYLGLNYIICLVGLYPTRP